MLSKEIKGKVPKGATHYHPATRTYYKKLGESLNLWCEGRWVGYYLTLNERKELQSLGYELHTVLKTPKALPTTLPEDIRPSVSLLALPENVRPHVTLEHSTGEYVLWDETGAYEVCKSHYPLVIVAAMETYTKEYLNKH